MKSSSVMFGILLCLLLTNIAQAECAWVLWMKGISKQEVSWDPIGGFPSYEQCQKAAIDAFKDLKKDQSETQKERVQIKFFFTCFPDTIDPRK
jgi:hypothetical protein